MSQNTSPVKVSVDLWKDHQKNIYDCSENDNEFSGEEKSIAKRWKSAQKTIYRYDIIVIKKNFYANSIEFENARKKLRDWIIIDFLTVVPILFMCIS